MREDGTVVIRKRSSKRRSRQPHKEALNRKKKRSIHVLGILFLLGFLAALGLSFSIAFHNSHTFEKQLVEELELRAGANIELKVLSVDYAQARASSLQLEWSDDTKWLSSLKLNDLKTKYFLGGLLNSEWNIEKLSASRGSLVLHENGIKKLKSSGGDHQRFGVSSLQCKDLDVEIKGQKTKLAEGLDLILKNRANSTDLLLEGGIFHLPILDAFEVNQGLIRILGDRLDCAVRFESEPRSAISLKGAIPFESVALVPMDLTLESISTETLFGESLAELFSGEANSSGARLVYNVNDSKVEDMYADLELSEAQVYGFPFLAELSKILRKQWYRRPTFLDESSLSLEKTEAEMRLSEIKCIQRDKMILLGNLYVQQDQAVSGVLNVGIPLEHRLVLESSLKEGVFSEVRDGYVWQKISVSGSLDKLKDDFTEKVLSRAELLRRENAQQLSMPEVEEGVPTVDDAFNELLAD